MEMAGMSYLLNIREGSANMLQFILQGGVTLVIAIIGLFVLPDFPLTTKWLTPEERVLAHSRMEADTAENQGSTSMTKGLKQACKDPAVWVFAAMAHMHLAANGL